MGQGNSQAAAAPTTTTAVLPRERVLYGDGRRSCVILGATGATGKELVYQLCQSPEWGKVTILHRRTMDLKTFHKSLERGLEPLADDEMKKVEQHVVQLDDLAKDENRKLFAGHDICFCVLGTTRAIAGSADKFKKVDLEYVENGAIGARKANVKHFSLLSSKGANADVWANDWKISHGLLYIQTKGLAEKSVISQGFNRLSIFRPGAFEKPGLDLLPAKMGLLTTTHVCKLAKVMIMDAESTQVNDYGSNKNDKKENDLSTESKKDEEKKDDNKDGNKDDKKDEKKNDKKEDNMKQEKEKEMSKDIIIYEKQLIDDLAMLPLYAKEKDDKNQENENKEDDKAASSESKENKENKDDDNNDTQDNENEKSDNNEKKPNATQKSQENE